MNALIEKMRKARERQIEIGGHKFTIRRPTDLQIVEIQRSAGGMNLRSAAGFVVGWDFKEIDLVPGGAPDLVDFDSDLFVEWLEDQPDLWGDLLEEIRAFYTEHTKRLEQSAGN